MADPLIRENTMAQTVIAVTNLLNFFLFLPTIFWKVMCALRSLLRNCKDIGMFLFALLGIIGFVIFLVFYFENEFNFKAKLSSILVPLTKTELNSPNADTFSNGLNGEYPKSAEHDSS